MKKEKLIAHSARHVFAKEYAARVFIEHADKQWQAEAVDVSKKEITISCDNLFEHIVHDKIDKIIVTIVDQEFELKKLALINTTTKGNKTHLVLGHDGDAHTSRLFWQMGYILRQAPVVDEDVSHTEFSLPKVPARGLYTEDARQERLAYIRETTGVQLEKVADTTLDPVTLVSNIEALVGSVEIPVGIAGPLHIKGTHANGLYYAPMATTEGALLASATRGATALSRSGGVNVRVIGQRMLRAPVFVLSDLASALFLDQWVKDHYAEIAEQTRKYSNYADLVEIKS